KCVKVGIPEELFVNDRPRAFLTDQTLLTLLPDREPESSKANYGKLLSFCGSRDMPGAAVLAALGALRCGIGLLTCTGNEDTLNVLKTHFCEPIFLPFVETFDETTDLDRTKQSLLKRLPNQTALLVGCGIGTGREQEQILEFSLSESTCPVICDADALTILSTREDLLETYGEKLILTPHPGEMARLCHTNATEVQLDRIRLAKAFSAHYGCTLVLKGNRTVIASPDGRLCINAFGNPGMAKAGMGDLLSGMIAAFAAQKMQPFDAATLGVYLHARAGDLCRDALGEMSMLTHDVADYIGRAARE
ncbi:MAG: NAD(P)H-hydrate dehydratase, partial [Clostridia bacterium]|nr:NAD(P)H-hydrate dehydratase [Clostridia bacterium]